MAPLRCAAKFDPFLSLDCASTPSTLAQSKERKGSNFAVWQPWVLLLLGGQQSEFYKSNIHRASESVFRFVRPSVGASNLEGLSKRASERRMGKMRLRLQIVSNAAAEAETEAETDNDQISSPRSPQRSQKTIKIPTTKQADRLGRK